MTDQTYTPTPSVAEQIDAMVQQRDGKPTPQAHRPSGHACVRLNPDGTVEVDGDGPTDAGPGTLDSTDIHFEHDRLIALVQQAEDDLQAVSFDPVTGAKSFVLQGPERDIREREFASLKESLAWQTERFNQALAARALREAVREAEADIAAAKTAFTQGDPERTAMLERAIAEVEAREMAKFIVAQRRAKGGA